MSALPGTRRKRRPTWTERERLALLDLGILRFWPERISGPKQIDEDRAIRRCRDHEGQRVVELVFNTPEAKRFLKERKRKDAKSEKLKRLDSKSQLSVLCDWLNLPESLWGDAIWRECMVLRYARPNPSAVEWIDAVWRAKIDDAISHLRRSDQPTALSDEEISQIVYESADPYRSGPGMIAIGKAYLMEQLDIKPALPVDIHQPISNSGIFPAIALYWSLERSTPHFEKRPTLEEFVLYPIIPSGHKLEWIGKALYLLIEIERGFGVVPAEQIDEALRSIWPEPCNMSEIRPSKEFQWISDRYSNELGVLPGVFEDIFLVYHIVALEEFGRRREAIRQKAFWFAKLFVILQRGQHTNCVRTVEKIRSALIAPYLKEKPQRSRRKHWKALAAELRKLLDDKISLDAVLHSEAFDGRSWLGIEQERGRPERRAHGIAAAYAFRRLFVKKEHKALESVRVILNAPPDTLSSSFRRSIDLIRGNSPYSYLAPLITSLQSQAAYLCSRYAAIQMCNRYSKRSELKRFEGNLSEQFSATRRWLQQNELL